MSPQYETLIRKEWHERKWQLAATTTWIVGGSLYTVGYELAHRVRAPVAGFYSICLSFSLFTAVILAMRTALGESTQKTIGFSASLPISLRRIAGVRLGGAIAVLVGPIVLAAVIFSGLLLSGLIAQAASGDHDIMKASRAILTPAQAVGFLWTATAVQVAQGIELLLVLIVIGARRRTEAQVGFIGAVVAFLSLSLMGYHAVLQQNVSPIRGTIHCSFFPQSLAINYGYKYEEGTLGDLRIAPFAWTSLAANLFVLAALALWFARRYGTAAAASSGGPSIWRSWRLPAVLSRVPIRWPGRVAALVWMDLRQSVPLAVTGLLLAVSMTVAAVLMERGHSPELARNVAGNLPSTIWYLAMIWATVVGSGIFAAELQPGLGQFWRSRPIHPAVWFWVKYLIGLFAVVGVLDGVTILVSWESGAASDYERMKWSYVACIPLLHATMYSLAVCGVCWLRKPVLGAMAGVLTFFFFTIVVGSIPGAGRFDEIEVYNNLVFAELKGRFDLSQHNYPLVYGTIAAVTIAAALLAAAAISRPEAPFQRREVR